MRNRNQISAGTLLVLALAWLTACDPGMTVRQVNSIFRSENSALTATPKIAVEVKTTHQLVGESWYDPQVTVTNSSDSAITITFVELITTGKTYEDTPRDAKTYPLTVPARTSDVLHVNFRLSDGVQEVFKKPGELRIHYTTAASVGLACITVARGPLSAH